MSSCVPWDFEDTEGLNPFNQPGMFSFNIWYELDFSVPEEPVTYAPTFDVIGVTCTSVHFDGEPTKTRRPSPDEEEQLADWFSNYIDSHLDEYEAIRDQALEYNFTEPDDEPDAA